MRVFVDSDGMTDGEVQRLGWADDSEPLRVPLTQIRRGRPGLAADPKPPQTWSADTVWGAAAVAHRRNLGEYVKEPVYKVDSNGFPTGEVLRPRNRVIMDEVLRDTAQITAEDLELGRRARDYISKALLIKAIKTTLSEFDLAVQRAVGITEFDQRNSRMEIAVIASQIRAYEQAVQLEAAMEGIHRDALAAIGAKVDVDITVVKSVFSENYSVFFITAVTSSRHAVFFSYRDRLANGHQCRVRGTVKAHRENSTQLNRVRIV